jgi:hypothetical protein
MFHDVGETARNSKGKVLHFWPSLFSGISLDGLAVPFLFHRLEPMLCRYRCERLPDNRVILRILSDLPPGYCAFPGQEREMRNADGSGEALPKSNFNLITKNHLSQGFQGCFCPQ